VNTIQYADNQILMATSGEHQTKYSHHQTKYNGK